jgi:CRP/FNR family transcriptional regulator, nitrogen fixation regulation protein
MHAELSPVALAAAWPTGAAFRPLGREVLSAADALGVDGVRLAFARNEEIFGESEPAACVFRVLAGVVRTYRILADGRRQIAEFFLPGDVFGLESGLDHRTSAEAVCDCEVLAMRRGPLAERAASDGSTAHKLWALTLHHLRRSEEHMLVLGRKNAAERLAWFLLDMAERIPADDRVELPMSRQDIADYLGLTIETVSRTMTQLQDDGVIALPACRQVRFQDRTALADLAA